MADDRWSMADDRWSMADDRWSTADAQFGLVGGITAAGLQGPSLTTPWASLAHIADRPSAIGHRRAQ
jgi:hypothetical protein